MRAGYARPTHLARSFAALAFFVLAAAPLPGAAELSSGDYEAGARRLTPAQQVQETERIRQERARAEAAAQEREARAEQARREEGVRLASRPLGVRLVEARCGACHGPEYLRNHRYGWLGWWSVLLRMEYFNGARFEPGERRVIVAHLARTRSATTAKVAAEWLAAGTTGALLLLALARLARRRRRS